MTKKEVQEGMEAITGGKGTRAERQRQEVLDQRRTMKDAEEIINGMSRTARRDESRYKLKISLLKTLIICLTIVLCVGLFCAVHTVKYAIDRNFEYLDSVVVETETVVETQVEQDTDGSGHNYYQGGTNNKNAIGGELNGETESDN